MAARDGHEGVTPAVTADRLFLALRAKLGLAWCGERRDGSRLIGGDVGEGEGRCLVGHLNLIHPCDVQVLGADELAYLAALGSNSCNDSLQQLCSGRVALVLVAGGCEPPEGLVRCAAANQTPLATAELPSHEVISRIQFHLAGELADRVSLHGVFMEVLGTGVLLSGVNGAGKSELALELVTRGHRLIADDIVEFARISPDAIVGRCPEMLRDFMEVRGLGVLNARQMFGDSAIRQSKTLGLVVSLEFLDGKWMMEVDRLRGSRRTRAILGLEIPEVTLPVAAGRNLAVLAETAVRNHILIHNGYDAAEDFIERQRRALEREERAGEEEEGG